MKTCAFCHEPVSENIKEERSRMWMGYVRYGTCKHCNASLIMLYDERRKFVGMQRGSNWNFERGFSAGEWRWD